MKTLLKSDVAERVGADLPAGIDAPLVQRMLAYALEHPGNDLMLVRAGEMARAIDAAAKDWTPENMKKMIGTTARARRLWCDVTGEPLV